MKKKPCIAPAYKKFVLFLVCLLATLILCHYAPEKGMAENPRHSVYANYKEIPGVTPEEIAQIEALKQFRVSFSYGMCPTTEAFYDENGNIGGYAALFNQWLSHLFGIPFKPVLAEWDELNAKLISGKIDFTGDLAATPERLKTYFMTGAIAERSINLFRLANAHDLKEIAERRTLRFAFFAGSNTESLVSSVAELPFESSLVHNNDEVVVKLRSGEIDAFLVDGAMEEGFFGYEDIVATNFFPLLYTPVSLSTHQNELAPIISVVQKYLDNGALVQLIDLYNKGQIEYRRHRLYRSLTDAEQGYIAQHADYNISIPIASETKNYPISFYNAQEGEWQGIANDILKEISLLTGLEFKPVNTPDDQWHVVFSMLQSGEAVLTTELLHTEEREKSFIWTAKPYTTDKYALLSTVEYQDITISQILQARVGLLNKSAYGDLFNSWFPNHPNVTVFDNTDDIFVALDNGEIDLFMATRNLLLMVTNYLEQPGFKTNFVFDRSYGSSFGLHKDQKMLRSIISKAQNFIDTERITDRWTHKVFDYRAKLNRDRIPFLAGVTGLACVAFLLAVMLVARGRKTNMLLENTVLERTAELQVQTDAANVAAKAKGEFLTRMSHEIRTPLNAIVGMAHVVKQNAGNMEKTLQSVNQILSASEHLMSLINDVLDLSKIESGKLSLVAAPFELASAMQEVANLCRPRCLERGVAFEARLESTPKVGVVGDKLRLKQVLINLLGNAIKFTDQGGTVEFAVQELSHTEKNISLQFSVSDNGIGMTQEQIDKLFTAFAQGDDTVAVKYGGTGLGLAISQSFITDMGGTITVVSEPQKGSTFSFVICLAKADLPGSAAGEYDATEELNLAGKRILLADDVEINRVILIELLSNTGVAIEEAADGLQAFKAFKESAANYYDLIFMDIQMPNMDGYQATAAIRELERTDARTVQIVVMTANAYSEDVTRALEAGADAHVAKPIDIGAIHRLLREKIGRRK